VNRLVRAIDALSTVAGWIAGWLIVPMTIAVAWEVAARYVFYAPTKWAYEVTWQLYGIQFMLAAAYTLLKGGHIRTDVLYERWSPTKRATVDAFCYVLFFFPGMAFLLYAGWIETWHAYEIGERTGLRLLGVSVPISVIKATIPLTAALLLLQGVAEVIRCVQTIRGAAR
jgi:TRAP-type mannitol/chloroaromatic compound transport system permease small subunit